MSYHRKPPLAGLGDLSVLSHNVAAGIATAADIGNDPYLGETICRAQQLVAIENKRPLPPCANTAPGLTGGIGLRKMMPVLRGFVYAEQNRWVYPVAAVAAVGVPVLIGYLLGKGRR